MENFRRWLSGAKIAGGLIALGVVILMIASQLSAGQPTNGSSTTAGGKPAVTAAPIVASTCSPQFVQVVGNNTGNRVDADFAQKYAAATAKAHNLSQAQKMLLLQNSGNNAQRLAIWSNAFGLYADPNNWKPLVNGNCLSRDGQALYYRFSGALEASGTTFTEAQAPATGSNSGVNRGTYGVAATPGISGNRKAIKVTLADGSFVYIMVRCGNVVTTKPSNLPKVPTDNRVKTPAPPVTTTSILTPTPPRTLTPKNPAQDPFPRGNAPVGGGRNLDPGPGVYIPPSTIVHPPTTARVNPAPPVAATVTVPPVGSTPDPAPAPAPEPSAPAPSAPATGTSCAPGITVC